MDEQHRKLEREAAMGNTAAIPKLIRNLQRQGHPPAFKLHNVRYGFATNSSSSHSIILAAGLQDNLSNIDGALGYGWGNFTLASRNAKAKYIATAMVAHYRNKYKMGRKETSALVRQFFGDSLTDVSDDELWESYIDHQSIPCFPIPRNEEQGMEPFWDLLKGYIVEKDDVVILGGNDNDEGHPLQGSGPLVDIYREAVAIENFVERQFIYDEKSKHFTVFSPDCGTRIRFTPPDVPAPTSSTYPELIDLKITDYCGMGCDYCYMDSTEKGKHANLRDLEELAYVLGRHGVLEGALGGGEPTEHPDFVKIIKVFRKSGIIPSISTQNWKWLEKPEIWEAVAKYCGAVALSTQKLEHIEPWLKACHERNIRAHFHYVLGLNPLENLEKFLEALKNRDTKKVGYGNAQIVLLAYKPIGRAEGKPPFPYNDWAKVVSDKATWGLTIAIDSFLVKDIDAGIFENNRYVDPLLYENSDGRFSMFYDAVEKKAAAHSFVPKNKQISVNNPYRLIDAWNQIKAETSKESQKLTMASIN